MTRTAKRILVLCLLCPPTAVFANSGTVYPLTPDQVDIEAGGMTAVFNGTNLTFSSAGGIYTASTQMPDGTQLPGGGVGSINDIPGTACNPSACTVVPTLAFYADASGFTITGQTVAAYDSSHTYFQNNPTATIDPNPADSATTTYLAGTYIPGSYVDQNNNIEYGELFTVTLDNVAEWTELEALYPGGGNANPLLDNPATNLLGDTVFFDFDSYVRDGDMEPYFGESPTPEPATLTLLCTGLAAGLLRKRLSGKKA
jgi:hypothetical protein